jgi:hypothetical protein
MLETPEPGFIFIHDSMIFYHIELFINLLAVIRSCLIFLVVTPQTLSSSLFNFAGQQLPCLCPDPLRASQVKTLISDFERRSLHEAVKENSSGACRKLS